MHASAPPLRPLSEARNRDMAKDWDRNYVHSVDWRWLTAPSADGPGESWFNPTVDLVEGESMSPLQRLFAVADCANGIGTKLDIRKWTFLNTDLVVHIHRIPEGEWTGIRAETNYGPDGIGTTLGTLFDEKRSGRSDPAVGAGASRRPEPPQGLSLSASARTATQRSVKPLRGTGLRPGASARGPIPGCSARE